MFPSSQSTLPSTLPSVVFLSTFGSMLTVFTLSIVVTIAVIAWRLKQRKKRIEGISRLYYIINIYGLVPVGPITDNPAYGQGINVSNS